MQDNKKPNNKTPLTSNESIRLLPLDGKDGSVFCRVHGKLINSPVPHTSPNGTLEFSFRSRMRLDNLRAVRGVPGQSMIGPCDYFGNWEAAEKYTFSIAINDGIPTIFRHDQLSSQSANQISIPKNAINTVSVTWASGANKQVIRAKLEEYKSQNRPLTGDSLFKNSGLLEVSQDSDAITLNYFDASQIDLSSFKARLVKNDTPFKITNKKIPRGDEWRAVSYLYEPEYAKRVVDEGGGLFLETHNFAQSITPLDNNAAGFVTLGRWKDPNKKNELELIAVHIPFGYTLIIEENCIHGDTDLNGMFLMCMTSNHTTMSSADTVFIKNNKTKNNISINIANKPDVNNELSCAAPAPLVIYNAQEDFSKIDQANAMYQLMFNPLSRGWWKKELHDLNSFIISLWNKFINLIFACINKLGFFENNSPRFAPAH